MRTPTALLAVLLGAFGGLLGVLGAATPAAAHAALTGSDPTKGAVVDSAPQRVTLSFSEGIAMSGGSIRVLGPHGERADHGPVREQGAARHTVALKPGLDKGTYTVAWHGVSADSHPVSGAFTFSIGAPSKTTAQLPKQGAEAGGGTVGLLYGAARYAAYGGFVLLIGGAAFVLGCWPRGARERAVQRLVVTGWVTLTASTLVMLLLRNPYTGTGEWADALDLGGLKDAVGTKPGAALVSRLLLLGAAALFVAVLFGSYARADEGGREGAERRDLLYGLSLGGAVVAAGLAATWAMAEHASTGIQTGLAMPVDVIHLLAVAAWLGGVAALLVALYRCPGVPRAAVRRFSRVAFGSVLVLAVTGVYQSWRQVGSWGALAGTPYGRLLLVKVGLVALLVGVAWISRRWTALLSDTRVDERADAAGAERTAGAEAAEGEAQERELVRAAPGSGPGDGATEGEGHSSGNGPEDGGPDPERAAQLARQRAAVDAARRRRDREADPHRSGLRRSVLTEAGIAVLLLAVTTVLTGTEPARTEAATRDGGGAAAPARKGPVEVGVPFDTGGPGGKGTAKLRLTPGRAGDNTLRVTATSPTGKPVEAPEVKVAFTLPAKGIGPLGVAPRKRARGQWEATGVQLPMPGSWRVAVTVRTSDIDQVTEHKTVRLP